MTELDAPTVRTPVNPVVTPMPLAWREDTSQPRFVLHEKIARGGIGAVYRAWDRVLDRDVAVKVLLNETPTADDLRRFRVEAQVIGQLQHPNIPPIYDLGTMPGPTGRDQHYLAMKLIVGDTLAKLVKRKGCGSRLWLGVFEAICQGVGFAHERGYLHRDLKPANIMVGAFGEVQIMDWGLAKRIGHSETASDPLPGLPHDGDQTCQGAILGTPNYMAPEQARGEVDRLDERTDVFALGAILFELLTGEMPFVGGTTQILAKCATGEFADRIARLDRCKDDPAVVALCKQCLAFAPADRPANGKAVAEAVATIRNAAEQRLRDWELRDATERTKRREAAKRRRLGMLSLTALTVVVAIGGVAAAFYAWKANRAEKTVSKANEQLAKQVDELLHGNDILFELFTDFDIVAAKADTRSIEIQLADRLVQASSRLREDAISDPAAYGRLQHRLGVTLLNLGRHDAAATVLDKVAAFRAERFGPDHADTLDSLNKSGEARNSTRTIAEAEAILRPLYGRAAEKLGTDHEVTLSVGINMMNVFNLTKRIPEAIALGERLEPIVLAKFGTDHVETITLRNNLAVNLMSAGQHAKADATFRELVPTVERKFGSNHPYAVAMLQSASRCAGRLGHPDRELALIEDSDRRMRAKMGTLHPMARLTLSYLVQVYNDRRRHRDAIPIAQDLVQHDTSRYGPDSDTTRDSRYRLADTFAKVYQHDDAIPIYEELRPWLKTLAPAHDRRYTDGLFHLGKAYAQTRRYSKAVEIDRELFDYRVARYGPDHDETTFILDRLIVDYQQMGEFAKAAELAASLIERYQRKHGPVHDSTMNSRNFLGELLRNAGRVDEAIAYHRETIATTAALPPMHNGKLVALNNYAVALLDVNRNDEALAIMRQLKELHYRDGDPYSLGALTTAINLANTLISIDRVDEACREYDAILAVYRQRPPLRNSAAGKYLMAAGLLLLEAGRPELAESYLRESHAIREVIEPDSWTTWSTKGSIGVALLRQGRTAEAEPFVQSGWAGLLHRRATIPDIGYTRLHDVGNALIELERSRGRHAEAEAIRKLLPREVITKIPKTAK
jgi:tetratricopeptide (TPR) repeat protein